MLEKTLEELKNYFSEVGIDLDKGVTDEDIIEVMGKDPNFINRLQELTENMREGMSKVREQLKIKEG